MKKKVLALSMALFMLLSANISTPTVEETKIPKEGVLVEYSAQVILATIDLDSEMTKEGILIEQTTQININDIL